MNLLIFDYLRISFGCAGSSLHLCELSPVAVSWGGILCWLGGLLMAVTCCRAQAIVAWASVVAAHRLTSCGSWVLEHRLRSCGTRA